MISRFFIERPIFAAVLSVFIIIAGLAAMRVLPIAQYPEIAPPVVTVRAIYPGASAEVLEQTVAAPLEVRRQGVTLEKGSSASFKCWPSTRPTAGTTACSSRTT